MLVQDHLSEANRRAYKNALYTTRPVRSLANIFLKDLGANNAKRVALMLYTMNRPSKQKIVNILTRWAM